MAAASRGDRCRQCKKHGHYQRDCPNVKGPKPNGQRGKKWKGGGSSKNWCSFHKTNSHSDEECYKQKEMNAMAALVARLRSTASTNNVGSAHLPKHLLPSLQRSASLSAPWVLLWLRQERLPLLHLPRLPLVTPPQLCQDQLPQRRPSSAIACPKEFLVPSWQPPLLYRLKVSAQVIRHSPCWWIVAPHTTLSTRFSLQDCLRQ